MDGARVVRRWCVLAAEALGRERAAIDALNVFPVPDGDTGTNLHLTVLAAAEEVAALPDGAGPAAAWQALAHGALLGARGNSGVILSQVLRGMSDVLGAGGDLPPALRHASALAHEAVAHPVRGTMLSVLHVAAHSCPDGVADAVAARTAAERARVELRETTGQLETLARHGVVDAGAAGLCLLLEALSAAIGGHPPPTQGGDPTSIVQPANTAQGSERHSVDNPDTPPPAGASYEVMYLLDADDTRLPELRAELDRLGDSLVIVGGDGLWNVHVHADDAGAAIEAGLRAGRPHRVRVTCLHPGAAGTRGVVAITSGDRLAELFREHGATVVRRDAEPADVAEAIMLAGTEVVVLPDEATVAATERAARRIRGVRVEVIPVRAPVQTLAALAVHDPLRPFEDDVRAMTNAAGATRVGRVDDTDGDVAAQVLDRMLSGGGELVTLVVGEDAPQGLGDALRDHLRTRYPEVEVAVYDGGRIGYPLLIGVE